MLGAFKLNGISRFVETGESYFILYSTANYNSSYQDIEVDNSGNIYYNELNTNRRLVKVLPDGSVAWQKFGSANVGYFRGLNLQSNQNPIVGLQYPLTNSKFPLGWYEFSSSDGSLIRKIHTVNTATDTAGEIYAQTIDSSGNVYNLTSNTPSGFSRGQIIKYTSTGTVSFSVGDYTNIGSGSKCAVDSSGNVYYTSSSIDPYYTKLTSTGSLSWGRYLSNASYTPRIRALNVDPSDNLYLISYRYISTVNYDDIMKINSSGTLQWSKRISTGTTGSPTEIQFDSNGNCYIISQTSPNIYVYKIDSSGSLVWARTLTVGTSIRTGNIRIKVKGSSLYILGAGYVTGSTNGVFIAKLPIDGTLTGTYGNFTWAVGSHTLSNSSGITHNSNTPTYASYSRTNSTVTPTMTDLTYTTFTKVNI